MEKGCVRATRKSFYINIDVYDNKIIEAYEEALLKLKKIVVFGLDENEFFSEGTKSLQQITLQKYP